MAAQPVALPTAVIVDDEESIRALVDFSLQRSGFATEVIADGLSAYQRIAESPDTIDIVILDVMLPGMDGMEICRRLRQANIHVPIILLTAKEEEIDRVLGLEMGADDYVTKPFSPRELVARARAVLRRSAMALPSDQGVSSVPSVHEKLTAGEISIDMTQHEVCVRGQMIELTPTEFDLLKYFLEHRNRVVTRDQLLDNVWGYSAVRDTRVVDVHVSHLRDKIEPVPKRPVHIRTVRGIGYKFSNAPQD